MYDQHKKQTTYPRLLLGRNLESSFMIMRWNISPVNGTPLHHPDGGKCRSQSISRTCWLLFLTSWALCTLLFVPKFWSVWGRHLAELTWNMEQQLDPAVQQYASPHILHSAAVFGKLYSSHALVTVFSSSCCMWLLTLPKPQDCTWRLFCISRRSWTECDNMPHIHARKGLPEVLTAMAGIQEQKGSTSRLTRLFYMCLFD